MFQSMVGAVRRLTPQGWTGAVRIAVRFLFSMRQKP
jgi:hypothetical protein